VYTRFVGGEEQGHVAQSAQIHCVNKESCQRSTSGFARTCLSLLKQEGYYQERLTDG